MIKFFAVVAFAMLFAGHARTATLPQYGTDVHLGVASCAGSTCHGAVEPWKNSTVLQNEYVTWTRRDKHAKAYEVLLNDRSKRIARNLGLPDAHTAQLCLDCHADNVAADKRSKQFQISDGVGCESCHGGAARWLGIHVSGQATHQDNVNLGMYPTEDPVARAQLCLSCHFGDERKFVTHRLMGAGHPRMSFELDTFTAIQPAHYRVDADYAKRKKVAPGVQVWAIGQAMALAQSMEALADPKRGRDGIFPELVLFDCHACHHSMSELRWQPRASTGLGPGAVRLNDANAIMLAAITKRVAPELGQRLTQQVTALHAAVSQGRGSATDGAKSVAEVSRQLISRFAAHNFGREDVQALLGALLAQGRAGEFQDYAAAEQATMAMSALAATLRQIGAIDDKQHQAITAALAKCYDVTQKDESYKPRAFVDALAGVEAALPRL
jgi:hypothetical protein